MVWQPKGIEQKDDVAHLLATAAAGERLFPVPLIPRPNRGASQSSRIKQRYKMKCELRDLANEYVSTMRAMYSGGCRRAQCCRRRGEGSEELQAAHKQVHAVALREAQRLAQARRSECLTGAQAVRELVGKPAENPYGSRVRVPQVPLKAAALDEPTEERSVNMLQALGEEEAAFYSQEANVFKPEQRSAQLFQEIQEHYGFVGGSPEEYRAYFARSDLPASLWSFGLAHEVRALAGFSAVPKKDGQRQRKLLMMCACNYAWSDPRSREEHGLHGGGALERAWVPSDQLHLNAFDESNAFAYVAAPSWFWPWQAVPPVRAGTVWNRLPGRVQAAASASTWVFPLYLRLAMGSSHSVHILMNINTTAIGRAFRANHRMFRSEDALQSRCSSEQDEVGCLRLAKLRRHTALAVGNPLDEWAAEVRRRRQEPGRVFVVIHVFSGPRRKGDVQQQLEEQAAKRKLEVLVLSLDLEVHPTLDLASPQVMSVLVTIAEEGLIDAVIGGPPCATFSAARFVLIPGGPRPLRRRGEYEWGLPSEWLTQAEQKRLEEANRLLVNFCTLAELVASRGGVFAMEHPAYPGKEPYPSVWNTDWLQQLERRTGAVRELLDQCMFQCTAKKPTIISGTLDGLKCLRRRCDGSHLDAWVAGSDRQPTQSTPQSCAEPWRWLQWRAS